MTNKARTASGTRGDEMNALTISAYQLPNRWRYSSTEMKAFTLSALTAVEMNRDVRFENRAEQNHLIRSAQLNWSAHGWDGAWDYLPKAINGGVA